MHRPEVNKVRLIKMGVNAPGFATMEEVRHFFEASDSALLIGEQYAVFRLPDPPAIAADGLRPGETVLFAYQGAVVYVATAWSGRQAWEGEDCAALPYCFRVNLASLRRTNFTVQELENAIRSLSEREGLTTTLVTTKGWPILPDGIEAETLIRRLCEKS